MTTTPLPAWTQRNLTKRIATAVVLAPVVLWAVSAGGIPYLALTLLILLAMHWEWSNLAVRICMKQGAPEAAAQRMRRAYLVLGALATAAVTALAFLTNAPNVPSPVAARAFLALVALAGLLTAVWAWTCKVRPAWWTYGMLYVLLPGYFLLLWQPVDSLGTRALLMMLAVVWATDIGAYVFGRLIGGPKLSPRISPGKTWAGFFGGLATAELTWLGILAYEGGDWVLAFEPTPVVFSLLAQVGDLLESWAKRRAEVKDSSNLLPGHGGVMDRLDSLWFLLLVVGLALMVQVITGIAWG